jgi:hypothetical protein
MLAIWSGAGLVRFASGAGASIYHPSVSIRCLVVSHAPGIGWRSIIVLT